MSKIIKGTTPKKDGFRMPGEFEPQDQVYMIWPERGDNWHSGAKPAQWNFVDVANTISEFTPVTMCVNQRQFENAKVMLENNIRVVEVSSNDSWMRDIGPTFVVNDKGERRMVDWDFNAWGGLVDGLYFPWDQDSLLPSKLGEIDGFDRYRTEGFVLEGGSIHVDGEGTVITTEECLLSEGRNPHLSKSDIEEYLKEYLNVEKVIWLSKGIDPEETNGHVDDVACYVKPGEVLCLWTEDENHVFYDICQDAYKRLSEAVDAKGRKLTVHKMPLPKKYIVFTKEEAENTDVVEGTIPRVEGDICPATYVNYLVTNDGIIVPQFGDVNDSVAIEILQGLFPDKKVVGVETRTIVLGGGNIHCITQQRPSGLEK
jgi:agmatine deiminase